MEDSREKVKQNLEEEKTFNGGECLSISAVLGLLEEPFDQIGVATKTYNKHYDNPNSEYYHKTVEEICEMWSAKGAVSRQYGQMLDNYIGYNLNNDQDGLEMFNLDYDRDGDERLNNICTSFDDFVKDILEQHPELQFVTREQTVYYQIPETEQWIRGRFDALFYNTEKKRYLIVDWKSSGDVDKKPSPWTGRLLGPCKDLLALNWNTYTLQVYFYKTALESSGLLNEGEGVDCIIVQLPGHIIQESNKMYCVHTPAFEYNKEFMDKLFIWAHKKNMLLKKNGK
jgi:hypothetical protein